MADLLQIGLSGIYSSQANLATTSNNIANVNTEGYSRQSVDVTSAHPTQLGNHFIGNGSVIAGVERAHDQFAFTENLMNTSQSGYATEVYQQTSQLDKLLSGQGTSVAQPVLDMFDSLNDIADSPNTLEARQVFLGEAHKMASQYNLLSENLQTQYSSINTDIANTAATVTTLGDDISELNYQISSVLGSGAGSNANDLLDKRDQAITALSQYVDVSVVDANNDMINVYIGSGQPLVMGNSSRQMIAINGDPDPSRKELALTINGTKSNLDGSSLGGTLAGLFDTRSNDVEDAMNQLGHNVIGLTHSINEMQTQGMTLEGEIGEYLFNDVNATQSMQNRVLAHDDGLGNAQLSVSIDNLSELTSDEYKLVVDTYTPATAGSVDAPASAESISFTATNLTTGKSTTLTINDMAITERIAIPNSGISIGVDLIDADNPPQEGKTFTLRPTRLAAQEVALVEIAPDKIAAAAVEVQTVASDSNTGDAVLRTSALNNVADPLYIDAANPLQVQVTGVDSVSGEITYNIVDQTGVSVTLPDGSSTEYIPAKDSGDKLEGLTMIPDPSTGKATLNVAGVELELSSGMPQPGDTFTLNYNETGVGDNSNILAIADLQNQKIMNEGKSTVADVYSGLLSDMGSKASNADVVKQTMDILQAQSFERIQNVSGVNMDEEAANLLQYQQYYSASARVITVASEIFDTILQIR